MGAEREPGSDPEVSACIVGHFRAADKEIADNPNGFYDPIVDFIDNVGPIDFALLETVFRKNNFNTYLVAYPAEKVKKIVPDALTINVNDYRLRDIVNPLPFSIGFFASKEAAEGFCAAMNVDYTPESNLQNLRRTGVSVSRSVIDSRREANIRDLGLHAPGYKGKPRGDRLLAQWN